VRRLVPGSLGQIPEEILGFARLAAEREPQRICEIGTLHGGTSLFLCTMAPSIRRYVGIDLSVHNARLVAALAPAPVEVDFIEGSSQDDQVRRRLEGLLGGEQLDLLFIDGDHEYEGVRADFERHRDLVRPGGLIAFHDVVPDHPDSPHWSGGVPDLWRELRDRFRHWEFVASWEQDGLGIGVIENDPAISGP
jgi:predicted O-methyltransferase YrrM